MKMMRSLLAVMCAVVCFAGAALAGESCCQKAIKDSKECSHPCCVDAKKEGKVCEKCNKDLKDCCKDAVKAGKACEKCAPKKE